MFIFALCRVLARDCAESIEGSLSLAQPLVEFGVCTRRILTSKAWFVHHPLLAPLSYELGCRTPTPKLAPSLRR